MSDDTVCMRAVAKDKIPPEYQTWHWVNIINGTCGNTKNPDHLYCLDCMHEVMSDETLSPKRISQ